MTAERNSLEAALGPLPPDPEADPLAAEVAELTRRSLSVIRDELEALEEIQAEARREGKSLTRGQAGSLRALVTALATIAASRRAKPPWRRGGR